MRAVRARETGAMVSWLFRNRVTGEITIAQRPNPSLLLFLGLYLLRAVTSPSGAAAKGLGVAVSGTLGWWATDELVRGVNPFRRILGACALGIAVASLARTLA